MKKPSATARRFRNLRRLQQILVEFTRHGFGDIIARLKLDGVLRAALPRRNGEEARSRLSAHERIRMICESLGPTFIKLGQVMATRPDLMPPELVLELAKLQDEVPPFPYEEMRRVLEEDFGDVDAVFAEIDREPLAAASIAQVHRTKLADGRNAVIKVQRPGLEALVETDLDILQGLAELLEEYVEESRPLQPRQLVEEFSRALREEIDFRNELDNMQRYRRLLDGDTEIKVPEAYPEHCSRRVITMERIDGFKLTDKAALEASGLDAADILRSGTRVLLQSVFEFGFFHADPHPGNFLVQDDGVVCLLDFGMMGEIDTQRANELLTFVVAVLSNDVDMVLNQLQEMEILDGVRDTRRLRNELSRLLGKFQGVCLSEIDVSDVFNRIFEIMRNETVMLPADLLLVIKAVVTVEGIAAEVCPTFVPLEEMRPFLVSIYTKRMLDPREQSKHLARTMADTVSLLKTLPRDVRTVLRRLNRGDLRLETRAADGEVERTSRDRAVNRMALTLVLCTSMVLSTILLYYPPAVEGTPFLGYAGFVVTLVLAFVWVWSLIRSKGV